MIFQKILKRHAVHMKIMIFKRIKHLIYNSTIKCFNGEQSSVWDLAHAQDDVNPHILHMFDGTFSLNAAHIAIVVENIRTQLRSMIGYNDVDCCQKQWKSGFSPYSKVFLPRFTIVHVSIRPSVFSFSGDNFSKWQWIFMKLGVCIDIVEIWLGIAYGQISLIFDSYLSAIRPYFRFRFQMINWVNVSRFSPNLICA